MPLDIVLIRCTPSFNKDFDAASFIKAAICIKDCEPALFMKEEGVIEKIIFPFLFNGQRI